MAEHDTGYRLLFSHPQMVADFLRGFAHEDWVAELDFSTLERVETQHVSDRLDDRRDDMIWRVKRCSKWLYVYLLLEFQSNPDRYMAVRLLTYVGLLYQQLLRSGEVRDLLPPVVPIVLYNGERQWLGELEIGRLIEPVPPGLRRYSPRLAYLLLDEQRYDPKALGGMRNLAAALFKLEGSRTPEDVKGVVDALVQWLEEPQQQSLRRAFAVWLRRVLVPARLPGVKLPEMNDLNEVQDMLVERVKEWTKQWEQRGVEKGLQEGLQQGLQEGLQQGLQKGLASERRLIYRLIHHRFGAQCADRAERLLARIDDPERLAEVGEWILETDDGDSLLEYLRQL